MKKILMTLLITFTLILGTLCGVVGCNKDKDNTSTTIKDYTDETVVTYTPTLSQSSTEISIGIDGVQKMVFKKYNSNWLLDGIYAQNGKNYEKVFVGANGKMNSDGSINENGMYFSVLSSIDGNGIDKYVNGLVNDITVVTSNNDVKQIKLTGKGFSSTLTVKKESQYIEREIDITAQTDTTIAANDISFTFKTKVDEYSEYGYILSRKAEDEQYSLPYSFPALAGKLTSNNSDKVYSYLNVIDYYNTEACFKTARRRIHMNGYFEEGCISSDGKIYAGRENVYKDSICVRVGSSDSFYDLIYDTRKEYARLYDLDILTLLEANSNMNLYDWDDAAYAVTYDIEDSRGRPLGDDVGTWGPYGYQNGGSESLGAMNILKGIIRYAMLTNNQDLYDFGMKYLINMVTPNSKGYCFVMPLNSMN